MEEKGLGEDPQFLLRQRQQAMGEFNSLSIFKVLRAIQKQSWREEDKESLALGCGMIITGSEDKLIKLFQIVSNQ